MGYLVTLRVASLLAFIQISSALKLPPVKILNDGNKIPSIALGIVNGTMTQIINAIDTGLKIGYRHIFTTYGNYNDIYFKEEIEKAIGKLIKNREELFITIKLSDKRHQKDAVIPALNGALVRLGISYVNLLLMSPTAVSRKGDMVMNIDYLETWKRMEEAKNEGLAKSIGVMDFNKSQLDRLLKNCKIKPAVVLMEINPTLTRDADVTYCQKKGIVVMAHHPMGYLYSKSKDAPPPRPNDPILKGIMKKYKLTYPHPVLLAYLINRGIVPVPTVFDNDIVAKNIEAAFIKLTDEEIKKISSFNKNKSYE